MAGYRTEIDEQQQFIPAEFRGLARSFRQRVDEANASYIRTLNQINEGMRERLARKPSLRDGTVIDIERQFRTINNPYRLVSTIDTPKRGHLTITDGDRSTATPWSERKGMLWYFLIEAVHWIADTLFEADIPIRSEWPIRETMGKARIDLSEPRQVVDNGWECRELAAFGAHLNGGKPRMLNSLCSRKQPVEMIEAAVLQEQYHDMADPAQLRSMPRRGLRQCGSDDGYGEE